MARAIEEKRRARAAFVNRLYDLGDGSERFFENYMTIASSVGRVDREGALDVAQYLVGEGLAEWMTTDGGIRLTHAGIVEVERSRTEPDQPTEHFAPFNMIMGNITNSQIQQGTTSSVISLQDDPARLAADLSSFVDLVRAHLDGLDLEGPQRSEAEAELATLEAQAGSPKPKRAIVEASLVTLKELTLSVGGSVAAQAIMHGLGVFGM
jgi:hypothetical protein